MKRADNPGKHTPNPDPNSADHPRSIENLIPPIDCELQTSPRQESVIEKGDDTFFGEGLANASMEGKEGFQNIGKELGNTDKSGKRNKGKGRAEIPSEIPPIDLSLIESQSSLYQNLLEQEKYDPSIHGSSSRDFLGSSLRDSHIASSKLIELSADEQELIDNGILSRDEILQQRIQMSQYQGQGLFGSQSQSQGLFHQRTNYFARNIEESVKGESMAKSGPARGIDHQFIEQQKGLVFLSKSFESPCDSDGGPPSLVDSDDDIGFMDQRKIADQNDHELLDLNDTEIELLESGVSIEDILELREQIAQEQIQPLSAESLGSNYSQKSPSRE